MSDMLTRNDIAEMCAIAPRYVSEVLEKRQDFPRPALVLTQKMVRWARSDIMQWLEKQRKSANR